MSENSISCHSPCGRWYIKHETEHFLGETTYRFYIYKIEPFEQRVFLYDFPYNGIYFSSDYTYLFLERDASDHDIIEIETDKSLVESDGVWYKKENVDEKVDGMTWPSDNEGLVPLRDLMANAHEESRIF
jgi:hypothetical protein